MDLFRSEGCPVVLVSAPAGYGKSILASQWGQAAGSPVAWVQLDESHDDAVRLAWSLLDALGHIAAVPHEVQETLMHPAPRLGDAFLPRLAAWLNDAPALLLVLDDVHTVRSAQALDALRRLVQDMPEGSQLLLLTRRDPSLPLSRSRLDGRLLEIRTADLALTPEETRQVAAASGWALDAAAAGALCLRTEGWPAAVTLAALAMRRSPTDRQDIATITGDHRMIGDYLAELALGQLDDDRLRFMLATSTLEWMSGPLCDHALDTKGSADLLEQLARENLFVIPLDPHGERYRYHHLLHEWLRALADRRSPGEIPTILSRAAQWHEEHGDAAEAFEYARRTGDVDRAGRVILAAWDRYAATGQLQTLRSWLSRCTSSEIESDPQLAIGAAWVRQLSGDPELARRHLAAAAAHADLDRASPDGASTLRSSLANARTGSGAEGLTTMLRDGELVIASESASGSRWLLGGYRAVGIAHALLGHHAQARAALEQALTLSQAPALAYVRTFCLAYLSFVLADEGDWVAADQRAHQACDIVQARSFDHSVQAAAAYLAMATVLLHRGADEPAEAALGKAELSFPLAHGLPWFGSDMAIRCGEVHLHLGNTDQARSCVETARTILAAYHDAGRLPERLRRLDDHIRTTAELSLTPAELRLLPFLPTHLTLQEIAERTFRSRATVKSQAASIYTKLGVSSRSEAVTELLRTGLVTSALLSPDEPT